MDFVILNSPEMLVEFHRNLFEISINANNSIMVEGEIIHLKELRQLTISFLDNGGLDKSQAGFCQYCQGIQSPSLSENPNKAIISPLALEIP